MKVQDTPTCAGCPQMGITAGHTASPITQQHRRVSQVGRDWWRSGGHDFAQVVKKCLPWAGKRHLVKPNIPRAGWTLLWLLAEKEVLDGQLEIQAVEPAAFVTERRAALQRCPHHPVYAAYPCASHIPLPQQQGPCLWRHLLRSPRDPTAPTSPAALQAVGTVGEGATTPVVMGRAGAGLGCGGTAPTHHRGQAGGDLGGKHSRFPQGWCCGGVGGRG